MDRHAVERLVVPILSSAYESFGLTNCAIGVAMKNHARARARSRLGNQCVR